MKTTRFFSSSLLRGGITAIAAAGMLFLCQSADPKKPATDADAAPLKAPVAEAPAATPQEQKGKLIVYYFHGNMRCPTCHLLETLAKSEVETSFAHAIKSGKLEWKTVNVEEKGNEHFNNDYKLYTKSVILSTVKNGKETSWKNLDKIWQLVHEEDKYRQYIRDEVKACLEGKCL